MECKIKKKQKQPYKFFVDGDPIAYAGAASAEKPVYIWKQYQDGEDEAIAESPPFFKAAEAKQWIETECWEETPEEAGWVRETEVQVKELSDAIDATKEVLKDYQKTMEKFCREGKTPKKVAYMTPSGLKTKDVKGLEDQYQFNRIGKIKPVHLKAVREWLRTLPTFKMAKKGWEADTHVVGRAEMSGEDGCTLSIDKDISQGEGCWHINMNPASHLRKCKFSEGIGSLWDEPNAKGKSNTKGDGFMFLVYQAVVGDTSDGYKGLQGVGDKAALKALQHCKTKVECIQEIEKLYIKKAKKGYLCKKLIESNKKILEAEHESITPLIEEPIAGKFKYLSWDGEVHVKTVHELMQQHFDLAYQERSPTDVFNLGDYLELEKGVVDEN